MQYAEDNNLPGLLLLVDFEKAFDSLSWSFINKVMKFFGFGNSIISWIHVLYKNASLAVTQGGNISSFFNIGRGCRQGDPLSPYIFILCSEILAIKIRNNKKIKGININNTEFKISQYADDTSAILDGSDSSLHQTLNELSDFAKISGLRVNFDKTQVVWIGIKKYSSQTIKTKWKLNWGRPDFKLLGIHFHVDLDKMNKINNDEKIIKIKNIIKLWKRRYLTPLGKITVIKSLLLPILNHLFISLPNPIENVVKELNTIFYEFLWNGTAKIKRTVVVKQYFEGGLKMINIKAFVSALKATWIRRLLRVGGHWTNIIENEININNLANYGNSLTELTINKINNKFWQDVLRSHYQIIHNDKIKTVEQLLNTPLFQNNSLCVGGIPIINKTWSDKATPI